MITTETDIAALVDRVRETRHAADAARQSARLASEAATTASEIAYKASVAFEQAQNALVVAAGGTDHSYLWARVAQK